MELRSNVASAEIEKPWYAGGDIPRAQGERSDLKRCKDYLLENPKAKVSDITELFGHCGTMLRWQNAIRIENEPMRDREVEHKGMSMLVCRYMLNLTCRFNRDVVVRRDWSWKVKAGSRHA